MTSRKAVIGLAAAALVVGGAAGTANALRSDKPAQDQPPTQSWPGDDPAPGDGPTAAPVDYETNARGQTLGTYKLGTEPPELISAITDDGRAGFIYFTDFFPPTPSSPEDAVKQTTERVDADGNVVLPVYARDGKTQIGVFTAGSVVPTDE